MRATASLFSVCTLISLLASPIFAQYPQSPKRGLVSVSTLYPKDEPLFVKPGNGLTWYYNYGVNVTTAYANLSQSDIEFVPMLWGVTNVTGSSFLANVTNMINHGRNITHVLGFNEPDVNITGGGSQLTPEAAAHSWIQNMDPLRKMGIKVGAPVVYANESGFTWLDNFYAACQKQNSSCTADFMNIHCFGSISFVQSYLDEYKQKYPNMTLWITEFALPNSPLLASEAFFNESIALFDNDTTIERYSYFGAFRATESNVGGNASMLDSLGRLRDIGSWYLGGGEVEAATTTTAAPASSNTSKSSGARLSSSSVEMLGNVAIAAAVALSLSLS